jgi:uncharacterized protein involved in exopolysaccharide biosynthesis
MLQKLNQQNQNEEDDDRFGQIPSEETDQSHLLRPSYYLELVKRRWILFSIPFLTVLTIGLALAAIWPATYLSEGKILVQSQLIPTELVRSTVTNAAQERIQVIQQRTMTRDNLLALVDKFNLFPEKRSLMSVTQLVDLMKKDARIEPVAQQQVFGNPYARSENPTIVFTVGFEYSDPQTASQVANELITRILNEDIRDRTTRATDTSKFLAREVQRLQTESAAIDAKIAQAKLSQTKPASSNTADQPLTQLGQLKGEMVQKSALYSERHPVMQALKRQIAALEAALAKSAPTADVGLDVLETQQANIEKNLEAASAKLAAARLGETLERDQQSEKLEVIEQPTAPQEPVRPNRPKIAGISVLLALMSGVGLAFLVEIADKSIRRSSDLFSLVESRLVISVPYISTAVEKRQKKRRLVIVIGTAVAVLSGVVIAAYLFMPPLDLIIAKARVGIFR